MRPEVFPVEAGRALVSSSKDSPLHLDCDVAIVGSGASGAVVAALLAERGQRVLVLEEGPYLEASRLGTLRPSESMRQGWREAGMSFVLAQKDTPLVNMMTGRCVGGSSVWTGGVCFRTPDEVLHEWQHQHGLSSLGVADMAPFFEEVEAAIHVETVPAALRSRSTLLFAQGAARSGFSLAPNRRNTDGCCGCSRCNFGCPQGAKLSVDRTYLPRAVRAGARILSDCKIDRVRLQGAQAIGVSGRLLAPPAEPGRPRRERPLTVSARRVVLAAGAMHTPSLLFQSGLGDGLPALGTQMTVHPSLRVQARFDERVEGWRGALQSMHSHAFSADRITLMSIFVPTGVIAATMSGIGPLHAHKADLTPHLAVFGGMVHDDPGGKVHAPRSLLGTLGRLFSDEPVMTYQLSGRDRRAISTLIRVLGETYLAAGAREIFLPLLGGAKRLGVPTQAFGGLDADGFSRLDLDRIPASLFECTSQHPLGSCRMGQNAEHAVVDARGRVFGLRELYIVDGSILPSSLGVNPQLTIMAMATRLAQALCETRLP